MKKKKSYYEKLIDSFESIINPTNKGQPKAGFPVRENYECAKHSIGSLFCDFLEFCTIAIQNEHMRFINEERFEKFEKRYYEIEKKYTKEDLNKIKNIFYYLKLEADKRLEDGNISDILGEIFHHFELHNTYNSQFFTPQYVADFMASITLSTNYKKDTSEKGYIKIAEPCCGSGVMILGAVKAFNSAGGDYKTQFMTVATDIDIKCVHMTYIQCSLYGIPAIINHGDTLSLKTFETFFTAPYLFQNWQDKKQNSLVLNFENFSQIEELLSVF